MHGALRGVIMQRSASLRSVRNTSAPPSGLRGVGTPPAFDRSRFREDINMLNEPAVEILFVEDDSLIREFVVEARMTKAST
jgi:hypothetical protein